MVDTPLALGSRDLPKIFKVERVLWHGFLVPCCASTVPIMTASAWLCILLAEELPLYSVEGFFKSVVMQKDNISSRRENLVQLSLIYHV